MTSSNNRLTGSEARAYCFRLRKGCDLKASIMAFCQRNGIEAGCVSSVVGCVSVAKLRLADSVTELERCEPFEIINVSGTITPKHLHLHASFADKQGVVIGGHMLEGCIVSYTAEVCLLSFPQYELSREFDPDTGYGELVVSQ
ncbi:DNA-binding protein [Veronia nyctiphanis]|uniref:DNA-binding protein n=1 Tax=Veronia nyctiphanis TaxID=1278244 RepID=A0A4V1LT84_9GAMM|nr:PPC domain-containing DNA-binding protein [Veronia nyctiphanis]RXJ74308.1 DNA-binding protein [Veronia nyctiphanis]